LTLIDASCPLSKGASATERVNKNPLEAGDGLPYFIGKEKNEIFVEGFFPLRIGEVF